MEYLPTFTLTLYHSCMGKYIRYSNPTEHMCMTKLSTSQLRPLAAEIFKFFGPRIRDVFRNRPLIPLLGKVSNVFLGRLRLPATQSARRFSLHCLHASAITAQDIYSLYKLKLPTKKMVLTCWKKSHVEVSNGKLHVLGVGDKNLPAFGRRGFFG